MSRLTFMFALPRSRTQWWAEMIGRLPDVTAWHDPSKDCEHPAQLVKKIKNWLDNNPGHLFIADTSALLFHEYLTTQLPDMTDLYVMRPFADTVESVRHQTASDWTQLLRPMHTRLHAIRSWGDKIFFDFNFIDENALRFVMCLCSRSVDFDPDDFIRMCEEVIDVPICDQITYPQKTKSLLSYREIG